MGEFKFKKIDEHYVDFSEQEAIKLLIRGVKYLSKHKLLTVDDEDLFLNLISSSKIHVKKNLGVTTNLEYSYSKSSGELFDFSLSYDEFISQSRPETMISVLLDNLCQIIVKVKYPNYKIIEKERYDSKSYSVYGDHWVHYAKELLPEEYVASCKLAFQALNYFTYKLTEEQIEKLKKEFDIDFMDSMIEDYLEIGISEYDGTNEDSLLIRK